MQPNSNNSSVNKKLLNLDIIRAVAAVLVFLRQQKYDKAQNGREKKDGKNSVHVRLPMEFVSSFPYCNTTRPKMCYNI